MPRARRHYLPGYIWHITHRCHKKEFLLKFAKDRLRWIYWLFEAKKRFGLTILGYMITSNHIQFEDYQLREQQTSYIANSGYKKVTLNDDNTYLWNVFNLN